MRSPGVCVSYAISATDLPLAMLSLEIMAEYAWIRTAMVLITDQDKLPQTVRKPLVHMRVSTKHGAGFEVPPSAGGYNEIQARNHLVRISRAQALSSGCNWVLLCDADEFFAEQTIEVVRACEESQSTAAVFGCCHVLNQSEQAVWPHRQKIYAGQPIHDPHIRLVHARSPIEYMHNPLMVDAINPTQHCLLSCPEIRPVIAPHGLHLHMRYVAGRGMNTPSDCVRKPMEKIPESIFDRYRQFANPPQPVLAAADSPAPHDGLRQA